MLRCHKNKYFNNLNTFKIYSCKNHLDEEEWCFHSHDGYPMKYFNGISITLKGTGIDTGTILSPYNEHDLSAGMKMKMFYLPQPDFYP